MYSLSSLMLVKRLDLILSSLMLVSGLVEYSQTLVVSDSFRGLLLSSMTNTSSLIFPTNVRTTYTCIMSRGQSSSVNRGQSSSLAASVKVIPPSPAVLFMSNTYRYVIELDERRRDNILKYFKNLDKGFHPLAIITWQGALYTT